MQPPGSRGGTQPSRPAPSRALAGAAGPCTASVGLRVRTCRARDTSAHSHLGGGRARRGACRALQSAALAGGAGLRRACREGYSASLCAPLCMLGGALHSDAGLLSAQCTPGAEPQHCRPPSAVPAGKAVPVSVAGPDTCDGTVPQAPLKYQSPSSPNPVSSRTPAPSLSPGCSLSPRLHLS